METPTLLTGLTVAERITLFFAVLREKAACFSSASAAHAHILQCLWDIEDTYAADLPMISRMTISSFEGLGRCKDFNLRYSLTAKQAVLIHEDGAYGIYPIQEFHNFGGIRSFNIEAYKTVKPIVAFPNTEGKGLW